MQKHVPPEERASERPVSSVAAASSMDFALDKTFPAADDRRQGKIDDHTCWKITNGRCEK